MKSTSERIPFELSLKEVPDGIGMDGLKRLLSSILKRQIVRVVNGDSHDFDADIEKFIQMIWDQAYNKGLSDMDKMHALTDGK